MGEGNNERRPSYVPTSRGLEPYLWAYSPAACKFYEWLRLIADWTGPNKGIAEFTITGAGERLNLSRNTITRCIRELAIGHFGDVPRGKEAPPFIEILEFGRGRSQKTRVRIRKAKLTVGDFHENNVALHEKRSKQVDDIIQGLAGKMDFKIALGK